MYRTRLLSSFVLFGLLLSLLLLASPYAIRAQGELSPIFMPRSLQSSLLNPAMNEGSRVAIGLPSTSVLVAHPAFAFGDLIRPVPGGNGATYLALDELLPTLGERSTLNTEIRNDLLTLAIGGDRFRILAGASARSLTTMSYPTDLIRLGWNGNAAYLDQTMQLAPSFQTVNWWEAYLGAQVKINDKIRVGGRLKYLNGVLYAGTSQNDVTWRTASDGYAWNFEVDYQVQATGLQLSNFDPNNFSSFSDLQAEVVPELLGQNRGFAADLGIVVKPIERLEIGASALDLGRIAWNGTSTTLGVQGQLSFSGVDATPFLRGDSLNFDGLGDSLLNHFTVSEASQAIVTNLPGRYMVHAAFTPFRWVRIQSAWQLQHFQGAWNQTFALGAMLHVGRWLDFGLNYAVRENTYDLVGLQGSVTMGPVVLYLMSDHILAPVMLRSTQFGHLRFGMNLQIGGKMKKPLPPTDVAALPLLE